MVQPPIAVWSSRAPPPQWAPLTFAPRLLAQAAPVRIGYAIARTGPWTGGAQVSQEPNYLLWAEQQNAAGGLNVKGVQAPDRARSAPTTAATPRPWCAPTKSSWAATRST